MKKNFVLHDVIMVGDAFGKVYEAVIEEVDFFGQPTKILALGILFRKKGYGFVPDE